MSVLVTTGVCAGLNRPRNQEAKFLKEGPEAFSMDSPTSVLKIALFPNFVFAAAIFAGLVERR